MIEGGCACGAGAIASRVPMVVHCGHRTDCQTETGSAFVLKAVIKGDRIVWRREGNFSPVR